MATGYNLNSFSESIQDRLFTAYGLFDGVSVSLVRGYNISSIVKNSTGNYTITFTNPVDANSSIVASGARVGGLADSVVSIFAVTASTVQLICSNANGGLEDFDRIHLQVV